MTGDEQPDRQRAARLSRPVVVVDTTAFFDVPTLAGRRWPETLEHCRKGALQLIVPEVVLREAVRHQKEASLRAGKKGREFSQELRKAGIPGRDFDLEELLSRIESVQSDYEVWLRGYLSAVGVRIWPHPDISHRTLVDWIMEGRLPIKADGKGYRDALVWATVIEVAEQASAGETVYFVTANTNDFCSGDGLASALKKDLEHLVDEPRVLWCKDFDGLHDLIAEYLSIARGTPSTGGRDPSELDLVTNAVLGISESLLGQELSDPQDEWARGLDLEVDLPSEFQNPTISGLEFDRDSLVWNPHEEFEGGTVVGEATVQGDMEIDGFMYKSDWLINADEELGVIDGDWNEHMAWVGVSRRLELVFRVNVNPEIGSVEEVELVSGHEIRL